MKPSLKWSPLDGDGFDLWQTGRARKCIWGDEELAMQAVWIGTSLHAALAPAAAARKRLHALGCTEASRMSTCCQAYNRQMQSA